MTKSCIIRSGGAKGDEGKLVMKATTCNIIKATLESDDKLARMPAEPCATFPLPSVPLQGHVKGIGNVSLLHQKKYGVREASELMGISQTKVRRMIGKGEINVLRIGGKLLLLEADLEKFMQGQYGPMKDVPVVLKRKLSALPRHVMESGLFKKAG